MQLNDLVQWFREGGAPMYWVLGVDIVMIPLLLMAGALGIVSNFMPKLRIAVLVVAGFLGLCTCCGFGGGMLGVVQQEEHVERALEFVDPEQRSTLEAAAEAEMSHLRNFSIGSTVALAFGVGLVGILGLMAGKKEPES